MALSPRKVNVEGLLVYLSILGIASLARTRRSKFTEEQPSYSRDDIAGHRSTEEKPASLERLYLQRISIDHVFSNRIAELCSNIRDGIPATRQVQPYDI